MDKFGSGNKSFSTDTASYSDYYPVQKPPPPKYINPPQVDPLLVDTLDQQLRTVDINNNQELNEFKTRLKINSMSDFSVVYWLAIRYLKDEVHPKLFYQIHLLFQSMLEADVTNPNIWNNYGVFYLKYDKIEEAENAFNQALVFDPHHREVHKNLAMIRNGTYKHAVSEKICPQCQTRLSKDIVFCATCGTRV